MFPENRKLIFPRPRKHYNVCCLTECPTKSGFLLFIKPHRPIENNKFLVNNFQFVINKYCCLHIYNYCNVTLWLIIKASILSTFCHYLFQFKIMKRHPLLLSHHLRVFVREYTRYVLNMLNDYFHINIEMLYLLFEVFLWWEKH